MMQKKRIQFVDQESKREFVLLCEKQDFNIDVRNGGFRCDAKSILAIMAMPEHVILQAIFYTDEKLDPAFDRWLIK